MLLFRPFPRLTVEAANKLASSIQNNIERGSYSQALAECHDLITLSLAGLHYFQTYDWFFLRSIVTAGYVGWMVYSICFVLKTYTNWEATNTLVQNSSREKARTSSAGLKLGFVSAFIVTAVYFVLTLAPTFYYLYTGFALFFWEQIIEERVFLTSFVVSTTRSVGIPAIVSRMLALFVGLELLVSLPSIFSEGEEEKNICYSCHDQVAGYFMRELLSVLLVLISLWPLTLPVSFQAQNKLVRKIPKLVFRLNEATDISFQTLKLVFLWMACCLLCSVFPALPIVKEENILLV